MSPDRRRLEQDSEGWEYYHAPVNDASRIAYGEVLSGERKEDAVAFLLRVVAFFGRQGVKISQLMTDKRGLLRVETVPEDAPRTWNRPHLIHRNARWWLSEVFLINSGRKEAPHPQPRTPPREAGDIHEVGDTQDLRA